MLVNRWQTRGGRYWCELHKDDNGYTFKTDNGGGVLGNLTESQAYQAVLYVLDTGKKYKIKNPSIHDDAYWSAKNRTANLSLDERCEILTRIMDNLNIRTVKDAQNRRQEISDALGNVGYLPMMFSAAANVWVSKKLKGS